MNTKPSHTFASGVWHAGNVHHILNNSFTRDLALTLSVQKAAA